LGGSPALPALWLAAIWAAGLYGVPLEHALRHQLDGRGHCHGAVCHDQDRAPGPEVRDGALPDLGDLQLTHGHVLAVPAPAWPVVGVTLGLRAHTDVLPPTALSSTDAFRGYPARGPPT
jgi:hypothetical protein